MQLFIDRRASPLGTMLIVTDHEGALRALDFDDHEARMHRLLRQQNGPVALRDGPAPKDIVNAIEGYFAGEWSSFSNVRMVMGGTAFQRSVWQALLTIASGTTTSYGLLAAQLGRPGASRAVGLANGSNPISIAVPCHRVIGQSGALTGYGGGLWRKRWLLTHEQVLQADQLDLFAQRQTP